MKIKYIGQNIEAISNAREPLREKVNVPVFEPSSVSDFENIFRFLNNKDRDILYLIFVAKKRQRAVQQILRRSQPSLCYDIKRIRRRLEFIYYLHSVSDIFLDFLETKAYHYDAHSIEIMTAMFYTTSLTHTATVLRCPQLRVRYRFEKIIKRMETLGHWDVYEIFKAIRSNLNIVRRVYY